MRIAVTGGLLAAVIGVVLWFANVAEPQDDSFPAAATGGETSLTTQSVTRRTLEHTEEFVGLVGYGTIFPLPGSRPGIVTWVPDEGAVLRPGDVLYRIDDNPTYWTQGSLPMYRELARGSEGNDVAQLQRYLQAEGYLSEDAKIDGEFGRMRRLGLRTVIFDLEPALS